MSRLAAIERGFSAVSRLARLSLLALSTLLFATSCIVASPPQYRDPVQSRPQLNVYAATPQTQQVVVIDTTSKAGTKFSVPVQSEDGGDDLSGVFFLDYQVTAAEAFLAQVRLTASTFDDVGREATFTWTSTMPRGKTGCHYVSLIIAHRSSFLDDDTTHLDKAKGVKDGAIVTWVVNVNPPAGQEQTLIDCPARAPTVP